MAFLNRNYLSLHGRVLGLFRGLITAGDSFLGGDGFQGVLKSTADTLTATGATQATALALTALVNRFSTVAAGTGAALPPSAPGMEVIVANDGASALQVYPNTSDTGATIDSVAAVTGVPITAAKRTTFICTSAGVWITLEGTKTA